MAPDAQAGHPDQPTAARQLILPVLVFGVVEVRRLRRELEAIEDFTRNAELRQAGNQPSLPRPSRLLDALATENKGNLLQPEDRRQLDDFLRHIEASAPSVHMSFASDPSSSFTAKVVSWLRINVHPHVLLQIGLQPTLAAGCILRTPSKVFDFSLRQRFYDQKATLLQSFDPQAPVVAAAPVGDPTAVIAPTVPQAPQEAAAP